MGAIATVRIASNQTEQGYIVINEADFDEKIHKLYEEKPAKGGRMDAKADKADKAEA